MDLDAMEPAAFGVNMEMERVPQPPRTIPHLATSASHGDLVRVAQLAAEIPCTASAPSSPDTRVTFSSSSVPRARSHAVAFSPLSVAPPRGRGHRRAVSDTFPIQDVNFAQFLRSDSISEEKQELTADESGHHRMMRDLQTTAAETDAMMSAGLHCRRDSTGMDSSVPGRVNLDAVENLNAEISCLLANRPQLPARKASAGHSGISTYELASMDPKRVKRIIANRQSAARSKERKMRYTNELEAKTLNLQANLNKIKDELTDLQQATDKASNENAELLQHVHLLEQAQKQQDTTRASLEEKIACLRGGAHVGIPPPSLKPNHQWTGQQADVPQQAPVHVYSPSPPNGIRLPPGMVIQLPDGRKLELPEGATIGGTSQPQPGPGATGNSGMETIGSQPHLQLQCEAVQITTPGSLQAPGSIHGTAAGTSVLTQLAAVPGALEAVMRALPPSAAASAPVAPLSELRCSMPMACSSPGVAIQGGVLSPEAPLKVSVPTQMPSDSDATYRAPQLVGDPGFRTEARPGNQLNKQESMEIIAGLLGSEALDTSEIDTWLNTMQRDGRPMATTSPTLSDIEGRNIH